MADFINLMRFLLHGVNCVAGDLFVHTHFNLKNTVSQLVDIYAKNVDERGRNFMSKHTLPSPLVFYKVHNWPFVYTIRKYIIICECKTVLQDFSGDRLKVLEFLKKNSCEKNLEKQILGLCLSHPIKSHTNFTPPAARAITMAPSLLYSNTICKWGDQKLGDETENIPLRAEKNLRIYSVLTPTQLSLLIFFTPPGARAIFLHSNVLNNNKKFVTVGRKNTGGPKHNRFESDYKIQFFTERNSIQYTDLFPMCAHPLIGCI